MLNVRSSDFWASFKGFLLLALAVVLIWFANFLVMPAIFPGEEGSTAQAGAAGDMFGGITALFSGLAFAGLVTTLFMQRRELELQRKELSQTREVFGIQRFEGTFFGLLKMLTDHVNSIEVSKSDLGFFRSPTQKTFPVERGRDALLLFADQLSSKEIVRESDNQGGLKEVGQREKSGAQLLDEYDDKFRKYFEPYLAPYFRIIYAVIRLIENTKFSKCSSENTKAALSYSKILRAHMNSAEVKLLMFNCASIHGAGLKGWVEKHSMLKHITRNDYDEFGEIVQMYNPIAFCFDERRSPSDRAPES